eukprot:1149660-Pelagomonas_calceolata.AAC.3
MAILPAKASPPAGRHHSKARIVIPKHCHTAIHALASCRASPFQSMAILPSKASPSAGLIIPKTS